MKWSLMSLILWAAHAAALVQEPAHCLNQKSTKSCLIKTSKKSELVQWGESQLWMSSETMIEISPERFRLMKGRLWVKSKEEIPFETAYVLGTVKGDLWLEQKSDQTQIKNLNAELFLKQKSGGPSIELPIGFENWFAGMQSDQKPFAGVLKPIDANPFLASWVHDFRAPRKMAEAQWKTWTKAWKGHVAAGSQIYQKAVDRELASIHSQEKTQALHRQSELEESRKLRQLYRHNNDLDRL